MASSCFAGITEETGKLIGGHSTGICANYTSANRQQRDLNLHSKTITAALEKDALERFMMSIFILCYYFTPLKESWGKKFLHTTFLLTHRLA